MAETLGESIPYRDQGGLIPYRDQLSLIETSRFYHPTTSSVTYDHPLPLPLSNIVVAPHDPLHRVVKRAGRQREEKAEEAEAVAEEGLAVAEADRKRRRQRPVAGGCYWLRLQTDCSSEKLRWHRRRKGDGGRRQEQWRKKGCGLKKAGWKRQRQRQRVAATVGVEKRAGRQREEKAEEGLAATEVDGKRRRQRPAAVGCNYGQTAVEGNRGGTGGERKMVAGDKSRGGRRGATGSIMEEGGTGDNRSLRGDRAS
ncbi:hypothetical protein BHM03_00016833 [Ensete ventricosum]|nr:hypothetical protein BHM03_00016833 [Ensete ventricosum]